MGDFGIVLSYLLNAVSFTFIFFKKGNAPKKFWGILATLSSIYFLYVCSDELIRFGIGIILKKF
jgi:hypothetical protein